MPHGGQRRRQAGRRGGGSRSPKRPDAAKKKRAFERLWALLTLGDYDGALAYLRGLGPQDAEPFWIAYHLGKVHGYRGEWEEALPYLLEAVRLDPRNPVLHHGVGSAFRNLRRFAEAAAADAQAIRLQRDYVEGWQSLGMDRLQDGAPDAAETFFRIALAHLVRQGLIAAGFDAPPLIDTTTGFTEDDPLLNGYVLPKPVAAHLLADGRFAAIMFHLGMAHVAADRFELTKHAFETALKMGLDGVERRNAEEFLERYARGGLHRRTN